MLVFKYLVFPLVLLITFPYWLSLAVWDLWKNDILPEDHNGLLERYMMKLEKLFLSNL